MKGLDGGLAPHLALNGARGLSPSAAIKWPSFSSRKSWNVGLE